MRALLAICAASCVILVMALVVVPGVQHSRAKSKHANYVECLDTVYDYVVANTPQVSFDEASMVAESDCKDLWAPAAQ